MFVDYDWPAQDYWSTEIGMRNPIGGLIGYFNPAADAASALWLKRDEMPAAMGTNTTFLQSLDVVEIDIDGMNLEDLQVDPDIFTELHLSEEELAELGMNMEDIVLLKQETQPVEDLVEPKPKDADATTAVSALIAVVELSWTGAIMSISALAPTGQL